MRKIVILGLVGLSLLILAPTPPKEPVTAAPIELKSVDGQTYKLADYKGKLVFLFFRRGLRELQEGDSLPERDDGQISEPAHGLGHRLQ